MQRCRGCWPSSVLRGRPSWLSVTATLRLTEMVGRSAAICVTYGDCSLFHASSPPNETHKAAWAVVVFARSLPKAAILPGVALVVASSVHGHPRRCPRVVVQRTAVAVGGRHSNSSACSRRSCCRRCGSKRRMAYLSMQQSHYWSAGRNRHRCRN